MKPNKCGLRDFINTKIYIVLLYVVTELSYVQVFQVSQGKDEYMENISKLCLAFQLGDFRDVKDLLEEAGVNITWHRQKHKYSSCFLFLSLLLSDILFTTVLSV